MYRTFVIALVAGVALGAAAERQPATTIDQFVTCINQTLTAANKKNAVNIADTVACVPAKCTLTGTISIESDQDACTLFAGPNMTMPVLFPRVILSCPGAQNNLKLRPSYDLCPAPVHGPDRVEVAQDTKAVDLANQRGSMIMADIGVPPSDVMKFVMIDANGVKNMFVQGNDSGSKSCNQCHMDPNPKTMGQLLLATPINPFGKAETKRNKLDLAENIIFTNEPGQKPNPKMAKSLGDVCKDIDANKDAVVKNGPPNVTADKVSVVSGLCKALAAYAAVNK